MGIEGIENFGMRLKGDQDCFSRGHTARTGQAVGQGDLSRGVVLCRNLILGGDFIWILHEFQLSNHDQKVAQVHHSSLASAVAGFPQA